MRSPSRPVDPLLPIGGTKRENFRNLELPCAKRTAAQISRKFLVAIDPPNFEKKFAKLCPGVTRGARPHRPAQVFLLGKQGSTITGQFKVVTAPNLAVTKPLLEFPKSCAKRVRMLLLCLRAWVRVAAD